MGGFKRFFQITFSLLFVVLLLIPIALLYPIPVLREWITAVILPVEIYRWIVAGGLALIVFFMLIMFFHAIFAPRTKDAIIKDNERGQIKITKKAIEATVLRVLDQYEAVKYPKVQSKLIKGAEDTQVFVSFDIEEASAVIDMAEKIQAHVINALEVTLGIPMKHVEVRMHEVRPSQNNEMAEAQRKSKTSRVQ